MVGQVALSVEVLVLLHVCGLGALVAVIGCAAVALLEGMESW